MTPAALTGAVAGTIAGRIGWLKMLRIGLFPVLALMIVFALVWRNPWAAGITAAVLGIFYTGVCLTSLNGLSVVQSPIDAPAALPAINGSAYGIGASLGITIVAPYVGQGTESVYFDCDTGIDDALTIAYLVAHRVNLVGIGTVCGNIDADLAARNTLDLLDLLGAPEVPVAVGARDFTTAGFNGGAPEVHGANGVGGVRLPTSPRGPVEESATDLLSRLARQHPGRLRVLAVGPMTNLGTALADDPELVGLVRDVTIMGGAAAAPGNVTAVAEANIISDPEAAAKVVSAAWDLTIVPLDVTMLQRIDSAQADRLRATGAAPLVALADMLEYYFDFYVGRMGERRAALHDPLAAAVMLDKVTLTSGPRVPVIVDDTHGPGRGQTIVDRRGCYRGYPAQDPQDVRVALRIDDDFVNELTQTLLSAFSGVHQAGSVGVG